MSTSAGEIVGSLRLDIADFEAGMAKATALADRLDGKDVNVQVDVDSAGAEAKLAAVAASEDRVDEGNKKVAKSSGDAGKGLGAMATAIITLGPALVPLAAGAAGLAVGFGAMGAAGVLAVVGIAAEMKAGSAAGVAFTTMLGTLKGNLATLGATAAAGVLKPFQTAVADLQTKMPALNSIIGEFSVITGKTAGALMTGLVSAFIALAPLARDAGVYILDLSNRFAALMAGGGVTSFGDYCRSVFPQVVATLESVVTAAVRLIAALAPLGMGTLGLLRTFADLINALPVDVLAALAQVASSVYIGFKTFSLLSGGITAVGTALRFVGASAETAAAGMVALNIAAGAIGVIIAIATLAYSAHADAARQSQQAVNDYTDALIRSNGAIDANVREAAFKNLSDQDAIVAARQLGLDLGQVTDAALGNVGASRAVGAAMAGMVGNQKLSSSEALIQGNNIKIVSEALGTSTGQFGTATQAQKDHAAAMATGGAAATAEGAALQATATTAGTTSAALVAAADGQKKTADAAANAAAKMYLENDAAGILKVSLDALNGKALSLMQAQTADAVATNTASEALKKNGTAIEGNTTKALDNQQALQRKALASQAEAEAVGKATGSTEAAVVAYGKSKAALEAQLKAQGLLTPAVQAYIDKLYQVSNVKVPPTKLDVDTATSAAKIAGFQNSINMIKQGQVPGIDANTAAGRAAIAAIQIQINLVKQGIPPSVTANTTEGNKLIAAYQKQINDIVQGKKPGVTADTAAGKELIAGFQAQISAVKQAIAPGVTVDTAAGKALIAGFQGTINQIKQGKMPGISADSAVGMAIIAAFQEEINRLQGKTVYINTIMTSTNRVATGQGGTGGITKADGGIVTFAQGGIQSFANGGENHVAQIAPAGAMRMWAEPETGGEAYIPLAPAKRARSTAVLDEVSKRFGLGGGGTDMSGVRADLADLATILRTLIPGFGAALERQTRTSQTMNRQAVGAR